MMLAATSHSPTFPFLIKLTMNDLFSYFHQQSACGKTSPESSTPKTTPSDAFWQHWPEKMCRLSHQGEGGRTLVMCVAPKEQSRGGSLTPNTSEWPNAAVVCLLSQVLEKGSVPSRFFLSSTACAGILRRAEKRGKQLPVILEQALRQVVSGHTAKELELSEARGGDLGGGSETLAVCAEVANCLQTTCDDYSRADGFNMVAVQNSVAFSSNAQADQLPTDSRSDTLTKSQVAAVAIHVTTQYGEIAGSLTARHDSSPCADRGQNMVAIQNSIAYGFNGDQSEKTRSMGEKEEQAPTLRADGPAHVAYGIDEEQNAAEELMGCLKARTAGGGFEGAVAFAQNTRDEVREMAIVGALAAQPGMKQTSYLRLGLQVRRLTPVECHRLQKFPDDHCKIPWRGKPAEDCPDGPQYKALGNSMAVPCMEFIGERIDNLLFGDFEI
jgi:hypothetical protein